jgi:hypothetical protein
MNIILNDGTKITDATVSDIQELISRGIIHSDSASATNSLIDDNWKACKDPFESLVGDTNDLFAACKDLCKDNDKIPPEYHDGEPEIDGNSPGFGAIQNLIAKGQVIDCPDIDFPQVNFSDKPLSANMPYDCKPYTGFTGLTATTACESTACNPVCVKIYANDSVANALSAVSEYGKW